MYNKLTNDNSYNDWASMSDKALGETIGNFIKHHRLNHNKTQDEVSVGGYKPIYLEFIGARRKSNFE